MVTVHLFGHLPGLYLSGRTVFDLPYSRGLTVQRFLSTQGLPTTEVGLIFINGRRADLDTEFEDGDRVSLFSPAGGG